MHLYKKGFIPNYYNWTCHGEEFIRAPHLPRSSSLVDESGSVDELGSNNHFRDMVIDAAGPSFHLDSPPTNVEELPNPEAQRFYDMLRAADTPIWEGCQNHSQLLVVARLLNIKSENNMSEKCFNQVSQLMKKVLPQGNKMINDFTRLRS